MADDPVRDEYEISLHVTRVKREHVAHTLRVLHAAGFVLDADGTDIGVTWAIEKDRDGVERWYEFADVDAPRDQEIRYLRGQVERALRQGGGDE